MPPFDKFPETIDDINLDEITAEDEYEFLMKLDEEDDADAGTPIKTPAAEAGKESVNSDDPLDAGGDTNAGEGEDNGNSGDEDAGSEGGSPKGGGEAGASDGVAVGESDGGGDGDQSGDGVAAGAKGEGEGDVPDELGKLRQEREDLEARLAELTKVNDATTERLSKLEGFVAGQASATRKEPDRPAEPEVTHEDIVSEFDNRIAEAEVALTEAETDPTKVEELPQRRADLRKLERAYNKYTTHYALSQQPQPDELAAAAQARVHADQQLAQVRGEVFREYPELYKNGGAFDSRLFDEVMDNYKAMYNGGNGELSAAAALARSVVLVTRANGVAPMSARQAATAAEAAKAAEQAEVERKLAEAKAAEAKAAEAQAAETASEGVKPTGQSRKEAAVERNLRAAQNTPPNIGDAGTPGISVGNQTIDFDDMPIDAFIALTENPGKAAQLERAVMMYDGP